MSNVHTLASCLEQLPDELWLLMLTYLTPSDRLLAFGSLNFRLNTILCEAGAGVNDVMARDSCLMYEMSSCIALVNLQHRCEIIDMYSLNNIRSLTMRHIMRHQIIAIDPIYMPNLTVLRLSSPSDTLETCYARLLELILNQNFRSLVSMHLPQAEFFGIYNCTGHSSLQRVTIGACRSSRFSTLIDLLPNLITLEIRHLISWPIRQTITHKKIRYLKFHIDAHSIEMEDTDALKAAAPSLKYIEAMQLTNTLSKCLPLSSYDTTIDDNDF
ncbi:unnamed protein product [Rotaria socialis]|uniref:F-box domain-containing protein n=2 Tax=Rotaria socialis TaxID=392032 RepID=A0A817SRW2_9BILA|nr:unnamed protein product [Rotaria socialis]CAF3300914.1 unnamed protein product [Rotaria socialis]CAF3413969.1 unnamed protein product [Rotaria socialis]CAF3443600.1 unnamed protein product [Rotaria socialis]CAF4413688.1 unnamed protein product [Rotaria socialis]